MGVRAALWGISATVGLLQNWIYSETAAMFPDKPGGISLYAHEGWRSRFNLFGPIGAFGYWIGWSVVLSFVGNIVGALIVAEWFPSQATKVYFNLGFADFGLAQLIAVFVILAVWLFNVLGVKPSLAVGYVTGALLMVPLVDLHHHAVLHRGLAFVQPRVRPPLRRFQRPLDRPDVAVHHVLVGVRGRGGASFAPEYHDTRRDTAKALKSVAAFSLFVYIFLPLGLGGVVGSTGDYGGFYVAALKEIAGPVLGGFAVDLPDREPDPGDEHLDRRRRPGALRDRARRHDDQVAVPPQPLPCPRPSDERRHGGEHRPAACSWARTTW